MTNALRGRPFWISIGTLEKAEMQLMKSRQVEPAALLYSPHYCVVLRRLLPDSSSPPTSLGRLVDVGDEERCPMSETNAPCPQRP